MDLLVNGQFYFGYPRFLDDGVTPSLSQGELHDAILTTITTQRDGIVKQLTVKKDEGATTSYAAIFLDKQIIEIKSAATKAILSLDRMGEDELWFFKTQIFEPILSSFKLDLVEEHSALQESLDTEAGKVRASAVSKGAFIGQEYILAHEEAFKWVEAGSVAEDVPESVVVWAEVSNVSNVEAAQNIITTRTMFNTAMLAVRSIRLIGKAAIAKTTTTEAARNTYKQYIAQLEVIENQIKATQ